MDSLVWELPFPQCQTIVVYSVPHRFAPDKRHYSVKSAIDGNTAHVTRLDLDFIDSKTPHFLQRDIVVDDRRHLIFYTDRQLDLLAHAKVWYMDGTFRVVNDPWKQLFSIHAFIKSGSTMKQIPLAFCIMSGKRTEDYYELKLVSEGKLSRYQRKKSREVQSQVFSFWTQYAERSISASQLLRECAFVYGPPTE